MTSVSASALKTGCGLLAASGLAAALTGCVSTQQKATWLHIQDARLITAQTRTLVRARNPYVSTEAVRLLRRGGRVAVAVRLHNLSARTLSDLPISVGIRNGRAQRVYLNDSGDLGYFQSHVALLRRRATVTWVLDTGARRLPPGRAFAVVGPRPVPALQLGRTPPEIRARLTSESAGRLQLRVSNGSSVPQPQLQLYAITSSSGQITAAGSATVPELGAGQAVTARLTLVGRPAGAAEVEALPTIFLP